jgi:GNAT superfamily N-acetyltransferase
VIRAATAADVDRLAQVERESWPAPLAASPQEVESRIAVFPAGQLLAEVDGQPAGVAWAQRLDADWFAHTPAHYDRLTDRGTLVGTHRPQGSIYHLIGVGVAQAGRGFGLGRQLVDRQVEQARQMPGVARIVGFTRPVGYHRHTNVPIDEYVELRTLSDRPVDPMLAFHLGSGARLVSVHADYRPDDAEACGYGILIEYPIA